MALDAITRFTTGNYAPVDREQDLADLPIRGELPKSLSGTLFRNGPNPQFPGADPHAHWFTGDGMIHALTLCDGRAAYRNRWVRTERFGAERGARRPLFPGFAPSADPAAEGVDSGVANTNIIWHAGRLLALEEAHLPVALDPTTLATRGTEAYGVLKGPFTAHPKIDPDTGEMIFFAYSADGPFSPGMAWGSVAADRQITHYQRFTAPYCGMVHDFVVTAGHVLFPVLPLTGSLDRARSGAPPFAWEPDKGAWFGVLPRHGSASEPRWFRAESRYAFHVMNAWEEGTILYADVLEAPEPTLFPRADGKAGTPGPSRLTRWRFDLAAATDAFTATRLDDLSGEFPRIDDRRAGLPNRYGWYACDAPGRSGAPHFDAIAAIDHRTGRRTLHALPEGDALSEPVFVPVTRDAGEGEGLILTVAWRAAENRSDLLVLNAQDIAAAPLATAELPCRVPFGFHGNWVAAEGEPA